MAKGYSGDDDSARMIHAFHTVLSAIDCNVWLEYVQSVWREHIRPPVAW